MDKISIKNINDLKNIKKITMITAYDFVSGYVVNNSQAEMILIGDSLGTTVLGYDFTNKVTIDDMIRATEAVSRVGIRKLLVSDLPYASYENNEEALLNASLLINSGADAVKLEGGVEKVEIIKNLVKNKIPVMGHIGITPQSVKSIKEYKVLGKTNHEINKIYNDAIAIESAGVFSTVLELLDADLSKKITNALSIPTIGIGSGDDTDGQVQVYNDLIGYSPYKLPKHSKTYDNLQVRAQEAIDKFISDTKNYNKK
tara:strand:- start:2883 stop:3653 length:771 start_codon:yes stop_codon:yes gene_type:complete